MNAQRPHGQAAQKPLQGRHGDVAAHRSANDGDKLFQQILLDGFFQRNRLADMASQRVAVAQQKKHDVQHHEKADHHVKRVLPDADSLRGDELAAFCHAGGEFFQDQPLAAQPEAVQQAQHPVGQGAVHLLQVDRRPEFPRLKTLIKPRRLLYQGTDDQP